MPDAPQVPDTLVMPLPFSDATDQARRRMIRKDITVAVICLVLAAVGAYFLYLDLNDLGQLGSGEALAQVEKCEAEVKRRAAMSFSWAHVTPEENLFLKDSLQTGANSAAVIHLASGDTLELGENSLIVMDNESELSLQFLRGTGILRNAKSEKKLNVSREGKTNVEELPVRLLLPASLSREFIQGEGTKTILFTWAQSKTTLEESTTLQVSSDKNFPAQLTQNFNSPAHQNSLNLGPGQYYWRVLLNTTHRVSAVRRLWISRVDSPLLVWPALDQVIEDTSAEASTQLRWVNVKAEEDNYPENTSEVHELEISSHSDFSKIEISTRIALVNGIARISHLSNGRWFWRILSTYDKRFTIKSENRSFEFLWIPTEVPVTAPTPAVSSSPPVKPLTSPSPGAAITPLTSPSPSLSPEPIASPSSSVSPSPELSPLPSPLPSVAPSASPSPLLPPPHPLTTAGMKFKMGDENFTPRELRWSSVPGAASYQITIYAQSAQSQKWRVSSKSETDQLKFPVDGIDAGEYSWTIRALSGEKDGQKIPGRSTSLRRFQIDYGDPLAAPEVVSPEVQ